MPKIDICAPHPSALFTPQTTALLTSIAGTPVTSIGPGHRATTLEQIVESIDAHRHALGLDRWVIWGMSGGSFLAQLYARMHPTRVDALILASSGPYFRRTVEDSDCILCPRNSNWVARLESEHLLDGHYDDGPRFGTR
jgi:pimeloyl-ACP methyl ester carboxylesterase